MSYEIPLPAQPRILVVSASCQALPRAMGRNCIHPFGGIGDIGAAVAGIVSILNETGATVHVAFPDYCAILRSRRRSLPAPRASGADAAAERVHRAQDRVFYHANGPKSEEAGENRKLGLAFQREVLHRSIPEVRPDVIHCVGSMTGLIPAAARAMGIPSVFTPDDTDVGTCLLSDLENEGIDPADFWQHLYYERYPAAYPWCRNGPPVDLHASGVFSADRVHLFSSGFLNALWQGAAPNLGDGFRAELSNKFAARCAAVIPALPEPDFGPESDGTLVRRYSAPDCRAGKKTNKAELQQRLGLQDNAWAPLLLCKASSEIHKETVETLLALLDRFAADNLQLVIEAPTEAQGHMETILAGEARDPKRWAVCGAERHLSGLALAGADFLLGLCRLDPAGLLAKAAGRYGTLPIVSKSGGAGDCVWPVNPEAADAGGIVYETDGRQDLFDAVARAMALFRSGGGTNRSIASRLMRASTGATARQEDIVDSTIRFYSSLLGRPICDPAPDRAGDGLDPPVRKRA